MARDLRLDQSQELAAVLDPAITHGAEKIKPPPYFDLIVEPVMTGDRHELLTDELKDPVLPAGLAPCDEIVFQKPSHRVTPALPRDSYRVTVSTVSDRYLAC